MNWDDHLDRLDALVATHFDTASCTALAMTRPERAVNGDMVADAARAPFTFKGTLETSPELKTLGPSEPLRQVTRICLSALAEGWSWVPRQGDRIIIDGALYQLASNPERDGTRRLAFWLNRISA